MDRVSVWVMGRLQVRGLVNVRVRLRVVFA